MTQEILRTFSRNQMKVARLTAQGLNSGQIAAALQISLLAVQRHQRNSYRDLGLRGPEKVKELRRILVNEGPG